VELRRGGGGMELVGKIGISDTDTGKNFNNKMMFFEDSGP
jgi:hypothetical protein